MADVSSLNAFAVLDANEYELNKLSDALAEFEFRIRREQDRGVSREEFAKLSALYSAVESAGKVVRGE